MRERTNQGGWIVNFAVVGMLLVLGLITSAYFLKSYYTDQGDVSLKDGDSSQQEVVKTDDGSTESTDDTDDKKIDDIDSKVEDDQKNDSTDDASLNGDDEEEDSTEAVAEVDDESVEELPTTGPGDVALSALAVSAITYTALLYRRSRQS